MHRLLIVDDDEILRTGIEKNIDWRGNGIEVVGTASNGRECMAMLETALPQIVLTDIKMPFMDGIQLSEAIYHLYPNIKIVLLTAYNDFEYAKKALSFKVCDYVMKYENNDMILAAVKRAASEYDKVKYNRDILQRSSQLLKNHFFQVLVQQPYDEWKIRQLMRQAKLDFTSPGFQIICFQITAGQNETGAVFWKNEELCEQYGSLFVDCIKNENRKGYGFILKEQLNVLLNADTVPAEEDILSVIQGIEKVLNVSICAGVGNFYTGLEKIAQSYQEAAQALLQNIEYPDSSHRKLSYYSEHPDTWNSQYMVLKTIKQYVEENFGNQQLSLNVIAKEVHLTPNYLSSLFKKYCQINIIDYITKIRIAKAKELLKSTDLKVYMIAEYVGYTNSQYFSVLFKKSTGMTPFEYRQKNFHEKNSEPAGGNPLSGGFLSPASPAVRG